jgi:hypothetical protein
LLFTLKVATDAFSAVTVIARMPCLARSRTFMVPRMFNGAQMICMPSVLTSRGIQKVSVLPEPVAAMAMTSLSCFRIAAATSSCQKHGICPKVLLVASRSCSRDGSGPAEFSDMYHGAIEYNL